MSALAASSPIQNSLPWSTLPQRWGHPWHPMSSYLGTFPAGLARAMITLLTEPGDLVLDPFSGRGTTLLETRSAGRIPLASDLSPIAIALSQAKNTDTELRAALSRVVDLEAKYDPQLYLPEANVEPEEVQSVFNVRTLAQLCYLRRRLIPAKTATDIFLTGAVLGILHGAERQDGSSAYASISMPNTFSMSPEYVRKFVASNNLQRVERNVFELIRHKLNRLYRNFTSLGPAGVVTRWDAKDIAQAPVFRDYRSAVKLMLTSPPYLDVVNYARQNWIRCWFLGETPADVQSKLDDNLNLHSWLTFMKSVIRETGAMMRTDGVSVFVIGDVARSGGPTVSLAKEFVRELLHNQSFRYVGCLNDYLETTNKTTRIWGDTKGQATVVDRIIFLANTKPEFRFDRLRNEFAGVAVSAESEFTAEALARNAAQFAQ